MDNSFWVKVENKTELSKDNIDKNTLSEIIDTLSNLTVKNSLKRKTKDN